MTEQSSISLFCQNQFPNAQHLLHHQNRPEYYAELDAVRVAGEDLTGWLEYSAEGLRQTLEKVWLRVQAFSAGVSS